MEIPCLTRLIDLRHGKKAKKSTPYHKEKKEKNKRAGISALSEYMGNLKKKECSFCSTRNVGNDE